LKFDPERVMQDIKVLSSLEYQGRETGTPGAELAAQYIAQRMEENGLLPAGERQTYFQTLLNPRPHLVGLPTMSLLDPQGGSLQEFKYRQDFAELARAGRFGIVEATVAGLALGPLVNETNAPDPYDLLRSDARNHILIVQGDDYEKIDNLAVAGVLIVANEKYSVEKKDLYPTMSPSTQRRNGIPTMVITPEIADQLLATAGSSLSALQELGSSLDINQSAVTNAGETVQMSIDAQFYEDYTSEYYINVMGNIPGEGVLSGEQNQVIIVSAYYDGLGTGVDGQLYAGANDNASGVALMLELARLFSESSYRPKKTIIFIAWAGGERSEGLNVVNAMNARPGASELNIEVVLELSGVGYGTGNAISLGEDSSYRLVKLFQEAASKYNVPTTTRGRGPTMGMM
jgi:hypothetical protein